MQNPNYKIPDFVEAATASDDIKQWHAEVGDLLAQAAILCVSHGLDVDTFMKGAWSAYVEARPGLKDYIEEMQLRNQLEEIRKGGRMGNA